jgi:dTDP-4-dehydrorhamnose reductase
VNQLKMNRKQILLLGNKGQLGWELERTLSPLGTLAAYDYPEIDLTLEDYLRQLIRRIQPQLIVNATAYTDVDHAESEPVIAHAINSRAPEILVEEAEHIKAALVHYSTDFVFDGMKGESYIENDAPNPLNVYGESKLAGEKAIESVSGAYLIFRTSWVYSLRRSSFVTKVLEWSRNKPILRVVDDQISGPTWARMLAEVTAQALVEGGKAIYPWMKERAGIYHLSGSGQASRLEWARAVLELDPHKDQQVTERLEPAKSSDFPTPAVRPTLSALNCDKFAHTFGLQMPPWRNALQLCLNAG